MIALDLLLHAADGSAHLDLQVVLPLVILGVVALTVISAPAPLFAGVRTRARLPQPSILWPVVGAWALALFAQMSDRTGDLHHGALIEGGAPVWWSLLLFLLAWQVMIGAMMLPSSLPLIRLFNRTAADQPRAHVVRAAFVGGYLLIWTAFGALAFTGDIFVHQAVDRWTWLAEHTWLIGGSTLLLAGAFQFSDLKKKCLSECRNPGAFLLKHYRRGVGEAFRIGRGHGFFCLGCCWALMLVGFAVGVANLAWMAVLTLVMLFEKTGKGGERGVAPIGVGLMALGVLVLLHPAWLPPLFDVS
jgi:predicted metal-binding membrane protein